MNKGSKIIPMILFFVLAEFIFAQEKNVSNPPQVEIAGTQLLHFNSKIAKQDYDLYINLPRNYSDANKKFPVLFLLDAQWDFPLVQAIFGEQYFDGFVPDIVVVGITWGGANPNYDLLRRGDFTPSDVKDSQPSGKAPVFLEFIKKELIPFVESNYKVSNDRALMGSSLGGLFTIYAMFSETNLFNKYILTSPALNWDNDFIYNVEKSFAEKKSELPVKLAMAIGGYEDVPMLQKFVDLLKERKYKNLEMQYKVIDGIGHSGSKADGYTRGMQFAYARPDLELDNSILEKYAGTYSVIPNVNVKLAVEDKKLVAYIPQNNYRIVISAASELDFYVKGTYMLIHFQKDESGKITGFNFEQYGGGAFAKKID